MKLWLGVVGLQLGIMLAVLVAHDANRVANWFAQAKPLETIYGKMNGPEAIVPDLMKQMDVMAGNGVTAIFGLMGLTTVETITGQFPQGNVFTNIHMKTIQGEEFDFAQLKGKVVLITNVACNCGHTKSNYDELNNLYAQFDRSRFEILGFPTNEFMQETGEANEITKFLQLHNVHFPVLEKSLVNGPHANPVYRNLKLATTDQDVLWNFETKFLVLADGQHVTRYSKAFSPKQLTSEIATRLN
ncbi:hypothetical protein BASA81_001947 [Batrachochytrium salamandrivorans]|nr:hypothetical protein BASA81_001947 [Batrachochytrium salamandrivorans]